MAWFGRCAGKATFSTTDTTQFLSAHMISSHERMHAMHFIRVVGTRFICAVDLAKAIYRGEIRRRKRDSDVGGILSFGGTSLPPRLQAGARSMLLSQPSAPVTVGR